MPAGTRQLTARRRLSRGLNHTVTGPIDVTRGAVGLSVQSVRGGALRLRRQGRRWRRRARPWVIGGTVATLMTTGGVAVMVLRRRPRLGEVPPRPPSVDVQPRP